VRHPNQVLSNEQLLVLVWGDSDASREQVKLMSGTSAGSSRRAPEEAPIETRRGFGYAYRPGARAERLRVASGPPLEMSAAALVEQVARAEGLLDVRIGAGLERPGAWCSSAARR
jgi:hypothetical protein